VKKILSKDLAFWEMNLSDISLFLRWAVDGLLWDAVTTSNFKLYQRVDLVPHSPASIPVRLYVNNDPPVQRRVSHDVTLGSLFHAWLPQYFLSGMNGVATVTKHDNAATGMRTTENVTNAQKEEEEVNVESFVCASDKVDCWRVSGITPPLTTSITDLWRHCSHPDHFLYIVVLVSTKSKHPIVW
jgi:Autophagy protein Apg5